MRKQSPVNSQQREVRVRTSQKIEIRKNADGTRSISGYAATFNDLSQDLGGFVERIQKGAFSKSLRNNPDVLCLYGHDDNQILGRVSSGTLEISEDDTGLKFTCKLPDTSTARDLVSLLERGDIRSMSFGFSTGPGPDGDTWDEIQGQIVRTLTQVTLYEISVVGQPAYLTSSVSLRNAPKSLRSKLKSSKRDDDEDENDEDECTCDCPECLAGDHADCTGDPECDFDNEDEDDVTRAAHLALLRRRL